MTKIISVIGCGAVGLAQLYHLTQKIIKNNLTQQFEILVFEKSDYVGRGFAYAPDDDSNLLNRNAGTMSIIDDTKDDFQTWLQENKNKWKLLYSNVPILKIKDLFLPRSLFGLYCENYFQKIINSAGEHKLKIKIIQQEVTSLQKINNQYKLITKNAGVFYSDIAILALGNVSDNRFKDLYCDHFYNSPYPTNKLNIPKEASVGILGSRLSAIDAAIALHKNDHQGKLTFISRGGYLPSIRSPSYSFQLKFITPDLLRRYKKITIRTIINWVTKEVENELGIKSSFSNWFNRPHDPKQYLESEFKMYHTQERTVWQAVLIALNANIATMWHKLKDADKMIFNAFFKSKWTAYRVGIPLENAKKIYHLFNTKQINLIKSPITILIKNDKFVVTRESHQDEFDYLINATGNCSDLKTIQSSLLQDMYKSGLVNPHRFGGVEIDVDTSNIINSDGLCEDNLYIVGNLTSGAYLFTSVLEINVAHTNRIAERIISNFISDTNKSKLLFNANSIFPSALYAEQVAINS